jgi:exodeoxyribonuclease V alpha subunit
LTELQPGEPLPESVRQLVVTEYGVCLRSGDGAEALAALDRFRVLCAHRRGLLGVEGVNATVERWLASSGLVRPSGELWHGRPVIVTRNDYQVGLFNGDVGLYWQGPDGLAVLFPTPDRGVRAVAPGRLPPHETVFAMTVHKSQGSEFEHVLVVLPDRPSPVVTRELLYTAVTRAKTRVTVVGAPDVVQEAAKARIVRASGLRRALWGHGSDTTS